jgi:hypothetical protein
MKCISSYRTAIHSRKFLGLYKLLTHRIHLPKNVHASNRQVGHSSSEICIASSVPETESLCTRMSLNCSVVRMLHNELLGGLCWEANSCSADQEISSIMKIHYHVHNQWFLSSARQKSTPYKHLSLQFILILFSNVCLGFPSGLCPPGFLTKTFMGWTVEGLEFGSR